MFEVGVVASFEARHRLVGDFGPASEPHGHRYRLEVAVRGPRLQADGTLLDITILSAAVDDLISLIDGRDLNRVPGLDDRNTTAEGVAEFVFSTIKPRLAGRALASLRARVWESAEAYASFEGDLS